MTEPGGNAPDDDVIPVWIIGEPRLAREAMREVLPSHGPIEVVGVSSVETDQARGGYVPLDHVLPREPVVLAITARVGAVDFARTAVRSAEGARGIVMVGGFERREEVLEVLHEGVRGCVSYDAGIQRIVEAIRCVFGGTGYLCPIVGTLISAPRATGPERSDAPRLSNREREVLVLISTGHTDRRIASQLGISIRTVHTHRQNLMAKLGVRTAAELIIRAVHFGLLKT